MVSLSDVKSSKRCNSQMLDYNRLKTLARRKTLSRLSVRV